MLRKGVYEHVRKDRDVDSSFLCKVKGDENVNFSASQFPNNEQFPSVIGTITET